MRRMQVVAAFAIGAMLSAGAAFLIPSPSASASEQAPSQRPVVSAQPALQGRFQIVFVPTDPAATFLLDTETGKTWQQSKVPTGDASNSYHTVWVYEDQLDTLAEWQAYIRANTKSSAK